MSKNQCIKCENFNGYDGVGELWTDCDIQGMFKGEKNDYESFKEKITYNDLLKQNRKLKEQLRNIKMENEKLSEKNRRLIYHINKEPKRVLVDPFECDIAAIPASKSAFFISVPEDTAIFAASKAPLIAVP